MLILVEIPLNPYQGLKRLGKTEPLTKLGNVEIPLNPYQGLKHSVLHIGVVGVIVEIPLNPYQGLKLSPIIAHPIPKIAG